jgi:hypothetical protein
MRSITQRLTRKPAACLMVRLFATSADVRGEAKLDDQYMHLVIVVSFVQEQFL